MRAPGARYECQVDDVVTGQLDGPEVADGVEVAARVLDEWRQRHLPSGGVIEQESHVVAGVVAYRAVEAVLAVEVSTPHLCRLAADRALHGRQERRRDGKEGGSKWRC